MINFPDFEFVKIECYLNKGRSKLFLYEQIVPLIPKVNKSSNTSLPNVLLLAIDSMSYTNFKRHFIRTEKLMKKYNFHELRGYTKVGQNTFPNMIPFLTGHHWQELEPNPNVLQNMYFDDWPIIWKDYSRKGFVTLFVEEMSNYGLFHFNRKGFTVKPTDYQSRPFHMLIRKDKHNKYCYKWKTETEVFIMNY